MLLEYYGVPHDYKKLRKEIGVFHFGTFMPQLGLYLIKRGFEIEIITMHPALFTLFTTFANERELVEHLTSVRKILPQKHDRIGLNFFLQFIQAGGVVTPRIPVTQDIQKEIDYNRPLLCSLTHRLLFKSELKPKFSFHFNIITGYNAKKIYVNDPDWEDECGGEREHAMQGYLYAIYANVHGFIDGASIMKIKQS